MAEYDRNLKSEVIRLRLQVVAADVERVLAADDLRKSLIVRPSPMDAPAVPLAAVA